MVSLETAEGLRGFLMRILHRIILDKFRSILSNVSANCLDPKYSVEKVYPKP